MESVRKQIRYCVIAPALSELSVEHFVRGNTTGSVLFLLFNVSNMEDFNEMLFRKQTFPAERTGLEYIKSSSRDDALVLGLFAGLFILVKSDAIDSWVTKILKMCLVHKEIVVFLHLANRCNILLKHIGVMVHQNHTSNTREKINCVFNHTSLSNPSLKIDKGRQLLDDLKSRRFPHGTA